MSITLFLILFTICEIVTPLVVEGVKKTLKGLRKSYNATVIALIVACISSLVFAIFAYITQGIPFTITNIFYIAFLIGANWLGSTLGYDKVKQALTSIKTTTEKEEK